MKHLAAYCLLVLAGNAAPSKQQILNKAMILNA